MIMFGRYVMLASRKMRLKIYTYVMTEQLKLSAGFFVRNEVNRIIRYTKILRITWYGYQVYYMRIIKALQNKYKKAIAIIKYSIVKRYLYYKRSDDNILKSFTNQNE